MTNQQAAEALAKARALTRAALNNHAKFMRAKSVGKTAYEALDRYERMSEAADALFDTVATHLGNT